MMRRLPLRQARRPGRWTRWRPGTDSEALRGGIDDDSSAKKIAEARSRSPRQEALVQG